MLKAVKLEVHGLSHCQRYDRPLQSQKDPEIEANTTVPAVAASTAPSSRVQWVDYAKGWSIVLVVTMHSALGVGFAVNEEGWLHNVVAFAKPFRMPDFFLVAGLFLGRAIDWPLGRYLDRKIVHFLYFFVLWSFVILAIKAKELGIATPGAFARNYLQSLVEPFSSLWFIQLLPVLFLVVRWARFVPPWLTFMFALVLHIAAARYPEGGVYAMESSMTGWTTIDSFSLFLIYFLVGHYCRDRIFSFAEAVARQPSRSVMWLLVWMIAEQVGVSSGLVVIPGLTLLFGLAGGFAVVGVAALMAKATFAGWLAYCGRHALDVYLTFVVPMAVGRILLLKIDLTRSVGFMSLIVAAIAISTSLAMERAARNSHLSFLYRRPAWARIAERAAPPLPLNSTQQLST